jgi:hypothetical protein
MIWTRLPYLPTGGILLRSRDRPQIINATKQAIKNIGWHCERYTSFGDKINDKADQYIPKQLVTRQEFLIALVLKLMICSLDFCFTFHQ